jgi:hypothetical protein
VERTRYDPMMKLNTGKYYAQWVTKRVVTANGNHDIKIVGWCVREKNQCGFIAETETEEQAEALAKLLNSQADIEERANNVRRT